MHLAIYNFALPRESFDAPGFEGFDLREPLNFQAAEEAEGFVARSNYDDDGAGPWGEQVFPRFIDGTGFDRGLSSLSVWRDIESLMAFTYSGVHAEALKNRHHWMRKQKWPSLVLWWVEEGNLPRWKEAVERFEFLHDNGVSGYAFDFKRPFAPDGAPLTIDRRKFRMLSRQSWVRQRGLLATVRAMKI